MSPMIWGSPPCSPVMWGSLLCPPVMWGSPHQPQDMAEPRCPPGRGRAIGALAVITKKLLPGPWALETLLVLLRWTAPDPHVGDGAEFLLPHGASLTQDPGVPPRPRGQEGPSLGRGSTPCERADV